MLSDQRARYNVLDGIKSFSKRHERMPSLRELGEFIGLKKSTVKKHIQALINEQKLEADYNNGVMISKSFKIK
jgi:DNA-binding transcriptional regulator YhcF (GntR family)